MPGERWAAAKPRRGPEPSSACALGLRVRWTGATLGGCARKPHAQHAVTRPRGAGVTLAPRHAAPQRHSWAEHGVLQLAPAARNRRGKGKARGEGEQSGARLAGPVVWRSTRPTNHARSSQPQETGGAHLAGPVVWRSTRPTNHARSSQPQDKRSAHLASPVVWRRDGALLAHGATVLSVQDHVLVAGARDEVVANDDLGRHGPAAAHARASVS